MFHQILTWLVEFVHHFGYAGIFVMTLLESTFVPIPSEMTVLPAGYLVHQGKLSALGVFFCGTAGTLTGSLINYYVALKLGRPLVLHYGKYMMLTEQRLHKVETFFAKYGAVSTFTGRLILGVRHFIAFPAGLARMPLKPFIFYTLLGGALWIAILTWIGYLIGDKQEVIAQYFIFIKLGIAAAAVLVFAGYMRRKRR